MHHGNIDHSSQGASFKIDMAILVGEWNNTKVKITAAHDFH